MGELDLEAELGITELETTIETEEKRVEEIAKTKMRDLNATSLQAAIKTVEGTARSMGILIE